MMNTSCFKVVPRHQLQIRFYFGTLCKDLLRVHQQHLTRIRPGEHLPGETLPGLNFSQAWSWQFSPSYSTKEQMVRDINKQHSTSKSNIPTAEQGWFPWRELTEFTKSSSVRFFGESFLTGLRNNLITQPKWWMQENQWSKDSFHLSIFVKQTLSTVYISLTSNFLVIVSTSEEVEMGSWK